MVDNGDKLVVTKKVAEFLNEGDIVKVTDVSEAGMITFAFGEDFMHMGLMSPTECEEHFEKIETQTITQEYIDDIISDSDIDVYTVFDKCTIVACRLPNGFVIVESSACVDPKNYDEKLGFDICMNKIKDKVWELEGYILQETLNAEDCDCCCGDCDCEDCDYYEEDKEFDECLDTDLDCDDCENYDCPFNNR